MVDMEGDVLSAEGVKSEEYREWKAQTLAKQTSHKEGQQRTGLWQQFKEVEVKEKDKNDFVVELAQGCKVVSDGRVEAVWSCPKYRGEQSVNRSWVCAC
jgi:hypothetical protein